jgi:gluconate kinase
MATRHGHFMPPALLHSQFEALEEPGAAEHPAVISIEPRPREIVEHIVTALKLKPGAKPVRAGT